MTIRHIKPITLWWAAVLALWGITSNADSGLIIKAMTDKSEVYVHGQLILNIEINTTLNLQNGTLSKPEIPGAILEPLVEDEQREEIINGIRQVTFLRSYAVFLSKAGAVTIPPVMFEGIVSDPSMGGFNGFFGRGGRRVRVQTEPIFITVKDIPSSYPKNQPFLPLKSLALIESFEDEQSEIALNKALTRRFEIRAMGTLTSFLPTVKAPRLKNCEVYSESGTKAQKNSPEGILATANFSQVYLASEPGLVNIPEQIIYWWDTDLDQLKTMSIKAFNFNVIGESVKSEAPTQISEKSIPVDDVVAHEKSNQGIKKGTFNVWPFLTAFFAVLWLATLLFFLIKNKRKNSKVTSMPDTRAVLITHVFKACEQKSSHEVLGALGRLYNYAKEHHDKQLALTSAACVQLLEANLYGNAQSNSKNEVLNKIKEILNSTKTYKAHEVDLAPLYPV